MQKELNFTKMTVEEVQAQGLPKFNNCNHYVVDMSHLNPADNDWMNTIVVKLPNGNALTLCVMQTSQNETCVDSAFHGDNIKEKLVLGIGEGRDERIGDKNIYALIARAKEVN